MDEHEPPTAPTPSAERHPDDLPPDPAQRGGVPRGVLWAGVLFVVVLTIASFVALSNGKSSSPAADGSVVVLDPNATLPTAPLDGGLQRGSDITGKPAPSRSFTTFTGDQANVASFRGRPVLVNFWASYCGPCLTEMPDLERIRAKYGDGLQIVGIDVEPGETSGRQRAQQTGVNYLLGFDPSTAIATSFGVVDLPTTVLVGRDGTVVYSHTGARNFDELSALIDENLHP
jgi:cytochrome c biogenesis protein CcmG, thiol:disulfide interchange protein DsbE